MLRLCNLPRDVEDDELKQAVKDLFDVKMGESVPPFKKFHIEREQVDEGGTDNGETAALMAFWGETSGG